MNGRRLTVSATLSWKSGEFAVPQFQAALLTFLKKTGYR